MSARKQRLKSALIETAGFSGVPRWLAASLGGVGAIIAMHRVRPARDHPFQPNRTLEVTPAFLDRILRHVRDLGIDIVSLDEGARRLTEGDFGRRFVCFTLDDGYADNHQHAFPVFKAHRAPFSIYVTTGFVDGTAHFWWLMLEDAIRRHDRVRLRIEGETDDRPTRTLDEKDAAFRAWHQRFRGLDANAVDTASQHLFQHYGKDAAGLCADHAMTWAMAREITDDGLGTIEAHTERHIALSRQQEDDIRDEMDRVHGRIAAKTGRAPRHFAFPFGDADAVTRREIDIVAAWAPVTAVTTRSDVLRTDHARDLMALPRITLNGCYQSESYVDLALSGLPGLLSPSSRVRTGSGAERLGSGSIRTVT